MLLVRRYAFFVSDFGLDVLNRVGELNLQSDRLAREGLDEDLHASAKTEDQMQGRFLLYVVVGQGTTILELFASEDETLLVGRNSLLVLDLGFDVFNGVRRLDFEGNGLARQGLHEDLHTSTEAKDQVKGGLLLDVVIAERAAILQLLAGKDETLLVGRDAFLVLDFGFDVFDRVRSLDFESNGLAGQRFHEDLHAACKEKKRISDVMISAGNAGYGGSKQALVSTFFQGAFSMSLTSQTEHEVKC